jgi:predicted acyltransferase
LVVAGLLGLSVGSAWGLYFPINKGLWTSSYVVFTAGAASLLLGTMFWIVEEKGRKAWAKPFVIYGVNAIAVFVASGLLARLMGIWRVGGGEGVPLKGWIYEVLFVPWAGPLNGSLAFALAYVLFWLGLMWLLYRRGVFIKI